MPDAGVGRNDKRAVVSCKPLLGGGQLAGGRKSVELRKRVGDVVPGCLLLHMEMMAKANPPMLVEAAEMDAHCSGCCVL